MKYSGTLAALLALLCFVNTHAYELGTHAQITNHAYARSVLAEDETLLEDLGLSTLPTDAPFGSAYYDVSASQVEIRFDYPFEASEMPGDARPRSLEGWLMRGAIREDDLGVNVGDDPHDDPYGSIFRVFNHFYDPIFDRPLTGVVSETAPNWALGVHDAFASSPLLNSTRRNHFTAADAREAMYRALTGKKMDGTDAGPNNTTATDSIRKTYWATTFRALGDVLHLNQDMAQPQHTRDDAHSGVPGFGNKSLYEAYVECRATGGASRMVRTAGTNSCALLHYDGYPVPTFARYSDYFSTREGLDGRGLADYSNRGFFSAGTNLGNNNYSAPSNDQTSYVHDQVGLGLGPGGLGYGAGIGSLSILRGSVPDSLSGQPALDVPLTTEGLWYKPLADFTTPANAEAYGYMLTRPNYDAMADLAIPRAVAYSAGLINYFFRGKMKIALPPEGIFSMADAGVGEGFTALKLSLTNTSPNGENMDAGQVVAVVRFHRNICYSPDLTGEYGLPGNEACRGLAEDIVVSAPLLLTLVSGNETILSFDFAADPIPYAATDVELQVVYRGPLGQEGDAVVATTLDVSEPTYFDIVNMTDYFLLDGTFYAVPDPFDASTVPSQVDPALFSYIDANNNGVYQPHVDRDLARRSLSYEVNFGEGTLAEVALVPSSFARLVVLMATDAPAPFVLDKLTYGYSVPLELRPLINQVGSGWLPPTPTLSRERYHYKSSPDHGFYPTIVVVPPDLLPLLHPQPQEVTLRFPME